MSHMIHDSPTHMRIMEAAIGLFARNASASMADLAVEAEVGRATLHRYFATRDALMDALFAQAHAELETAIEEAVAEATDHLDGLRLAIAAIIPLANRQVFLTQVPTPPAMAATYDASLQETRAAIDAARSEGSLDTDMPTEWIAEVYDALCYAAWTAIDRQDLTPRQATALAWRSFLTGISGDVT